MENIGRFKEVVSSNGRTNKNVAPPIVNKLQSLAEVPDPNFRPKRCRAIIFNAGGDSILSIVRNRPGRGRYAVYPGGGLEDTDDTAMDGVLRELSEELSLNSGEDFELTGSAILQDEELFFIGYATRELSDLRIHGPEADRDESVSGTYEPGWIPVSGLASSNMFPEEVSAVIENL